jgi:hypothetical protein
MDWTNSRFKTIANGFLLSDFPIILLTTYYTMKNKLILTLDQGQRLPDNRVPLTMREVSLHKNLLTIPKPGWVERSKEIWSSLGALQ